MVIDKIEFGIPDKRNSTVLEVFELRMCRIVPLRKGHEL